MACAMVWLEAFTSASRLLSSGSLKISHQFPCSVASEGCASFQPCAADESGTFSSLYAGGVSAGGRIWGRCCSRREKRLPRAPKCQAIVVESFCVPCSARFHFAETPVQSATTPKAQLCGRFARGGWRRALPAQLSFEPETKLIQNQVNHGRRVERERLAENQPANNRDTQRPAKLRSRAAAESERQSAEQRGHGRHQDRAETQQASLEDGFLGLPSLGALHPQRKIDHQNGVLLDDPISRMIPMA